MKGTETKARACVKCSKNLKCNVLEKGAAQEGTGKGLREISGTEMERIGQIERVQKRFHYVIQITVTVSLSPHPGI